MQHLRLANLPVPSLGRAWSPRCCTWTGAAAAEPRRGDRTAYRRQPVRDGGAAQRAAPRRAADAPRPPGGGGTRRRSARHLGRSEVAGLLAARVEALPAASREMVEAMACLGGRVELSVLQAATGEPAAVVEQRWRPPSTRACWWWSPERDRRCGSATTASARRSCSGLDPPRRRSPAAGDGAAAGRRCRSCSRSRPSSTCRWSTRVDDPAERRRVVGLLRRAADQARVDRRPRAGERAAGAPRCG